MEPNIVILHNFMYIDIAKIVERMIYLFFFTNYFLVEKYHLEKYEMYHNQIFFYNFNSIIENIHLQYLLKPLGNLARRQRPVGTEWGQESGGIRVLASPSAFT